MSSVGFWLAIWITFVGLSTATSAQVRVIDGDTLVIGEQTYRINGIDAPEHGQRCGDWACGKAATQAMGALSVSGPIVCHAISEDAFGRTIADCFVGEVNLGQWMVSNGFAWAFLKYSTLYAEDQRRAQKRELGIWRGSFQPPWEYRKRRWATASQKAPDGCPIKGNISKNGRVYHAPWSPWYERTKISTAKGERWFCSEAEAIAAGWRAPHWY